LSEDSVPKTSAVIIEILLVALLVFTPLAFATVNTWAISIMEFVSLVMVMVWLAGWAFGGTRLRFRFPLAAPALLFTALALAQLVPHLLGGNAACRSDNPLLNVATTNFFLTKTQFVKLLCYLGLYLCLVNTLTSRRQIVRIFAAIIVIASAVSFVGLLQRIDKTEKILWLIKYTRHRRFMAAFINENHFAGYMELVIPIAIAFVLRYVFRLRERGWRNMVASNDLHKAIVLSILVIIMIASLAISESRGGLIAFLSSLLFMGALVLCRRVHRRRAWVITLLLLMSFLMLLYIGLGDLLPVWGTFGHVSEDKSVLRRIEITRDTWRAVQDYPLWGSGLGTFGSVFPNYGTLRFNKRSDVRSILTTVPHAENDYVQTLLEVGWVGMMICLLGMVLFFRIAFRTYLTRRRFSISLSAMGGATSIFAILVHSFSDFNLRIDANVLLSVTIVAMVVNLSRVRGRSPHHKERREHPV
jgi:O-antigen ligase